MSPCKTFSRSLHYGPGLTLHCPGLVVSATMWNPPWGWSCFAKLPSSAHHTSLLLFYPSLKTTLKGLDQKNLIPIGSKQTVFRNFVFSGQAYTPIMQAYRCYHECIFTLIVNAQQSCFYCLCFNNGLPPRKK